MAENKKKIVENSPPRDPEIKFPDPIALGNALMQAYERAQPVFEKFIEQSGKEFSNQNLDPLNVSEAYTKFMERLWSDPEFFWQTQSALWGKWAHLWQESTLKFMGEQTKPVIEPEAGDRRFKAAEWQENALFDFIKQSYLLTCQWMDETVRGDENLDAKQKEKLAFYTRLYANALSPTNFLMTNPEVIRETLKTGGENLIKGFENLIDDLKRGQGELKISTTKYDAFKLGENIATTPGSVIYENDLIQLIQYEPTTGKVFKRPLLVIPPWINKYYILDLRPDNSFVRWAVEQGHTVFVISWVNPTQDLAQKTFEDYLNEGILDALAQIEKVTGEPDCNVVGYCLGGTLLATALSYLTSKGKADKVASATFLTTLVDFENSGEMKLFMDDAQLEMMNREMAEKGILQAKQLQKTFSLLRANDLIWSFVVNNYLMGKEPFPFDLLYWNDDSTNMPAAMHSFYLRSMYRDNLLTKPGGITMNKTPIDITKIKTPSYLLSTKEDHIAPWKATYATTQMLGGDVTFTLAASGHIAGVINAPIKNKYCFWSADKTPADPDAWMSTAKENPGSWWPHWQQWIENYGGGKVEARKIGKSLEPAPGNYVTVKSE
jgi:polyhydroxyalkanoate synthase subunit PhaC